MVPIPRDTRSRVLWLAVIAAVCGLAAVGGHQAGLASRTHSTNQQVSEKPDNGGLFIEPNRLDFGEAWEQQALPLVLPIENKGTTTVHVAHFTTSCLCTNIEPTSLTIPPGGLREVRLVIDLTKRCRSEADKSLRDFRLQLIPHLESSGPGRAAGWVLSGRVRSPLHFDPALLDVGEVSVLAQPMGATRTLVTTHVPLANLEVSRQSARWDVQVKPVGEGRSQFEVLVTPAQRLPLGEIKFDLALVPVRATGERLPEQTVTVLGQVVADVKPSLPVIPLGALRVGRTAGEILSLHSRTSRPFDVLGVAVEGSGLSVEPVQRPGIDAPTYRVRQQVERSGEQSGKVVFRVRPQQGDVTEVSIPVVYNGIQGTEG